MNEPEIALATCQQLPEPDPDAPLLEAALHALGIKASHLAWDDPASDWSTPLICVLRSTWNYSEHLESFLAWAQSVSQQSSFWNPFDVVRWNVHKRYLAELSRLGVATVPTVYIQKGDSERPLIGVMDEMSWRRVVIKPEVSAGSANTYVFHRDEVEESQEQLFRTLLSEREMMIQPYIDAVENDGERAVVWIDGEITHSVRKSPRFVGQDESVSDELPVADDERELALKTLSLVDDVALLYGRVDMVRGDTGAPMVMELELVEPSLFLAQSKSACDRLAASIRRRLEECPIRR